MSTLNFVYPTAAVMDRILPDLVERDMAERVGLKLFPPVSKPTFFVRWMQRDNYHGLQQFRGLDGSPNKVNRIGDTTYEYEPGVYGEFIRFTERELLTRAAPNNLNLPIPIGDLIADADAQLVHRENDRMEANAWNLVLTGTISIPLPGPNGPTIYKDSYTTQTYTPTIPWSSLSTAKPIQDLQTMQQLSVGHGAMFDGSSTIYMNQVTANRLINNSNAADYGGRRDNYGATLNNFAAFTSYSQGQNLPKLVVYDAGYQNQAVAGPITSPSTQFTKFIPDGSAVLVGRRPADSPLGETQMTINLVNPGGAAAGRYRFIKNSSTGENTPINVPPTIEVHRGWNGGPTLYYPSAIVAITGL